MNAIDTNVFVYAFDIDEPVRQSKAQELIGRLTLNAGETILLWQVAVEFLAKLRKWESAQKIDSADTLAYFRDIQAAFSLRLPTPKVFDLSFDLRSRFSLSHWDSMLLAACKDAGVTTVYSEDMSANANYDGLLVVNPFV